MRQSNLRFRNFGFEMQDLSNFKMRFTTLFKKDMRDYFCGGSRIQPLSFSRLITNSSSVAEGITCWRCFS